MSALDAPVEFVVAREPEAEQLQRAARARLRRWGGEERFREISALFLVETPRRLRAARTCIRRDDADGLRRLALSLRGACARMGAARMVELCEAIEQAAAGSQLADAGPLLDALRGEYVTVRASMERELSAPEETLCDR